MVSAARAQTGWNFLGLGAPGGGLGSLTQQGCAQVLCILLSLALQGRYYLLIQPGDLPSTTRLNWDPDSVLLCLSSKC